MPVACFSIRISVRYTIPDIRATRVHHLQMPPFKRKCGCMECHGDVVSAAKWYRHRKQVALGERQDAAPLTRAQPQKAPVATTTSQEDEAIKHAWPPKSDVSGTCEVHEAGDHAREHELGRKKHAHTDTVDTSLQVLELVAGGTMTVTGADQMLKLMAR